MLDAREVSDHTVENIRSGVRLLGCILYVGQLLLSSLSSLCFDFLINEDDDTIRESTTHSVMRTKQMNVQFLKWIQQHSKYMN